MLTVALRDIRAKWLLYQERFSQLGLTLLTEPFTPLSDTDELHIVCHVSQKLCPQHGSYRLSVMKKQVKNRIFPLGKIYMFIYLRCLIIYQYYAAVKLALIVLLTTFYFNPFEQISYGVVLPILDLKQCNCNCFSP